MASAAWRPYETLSAERRSPLSRRPARSSDSRWGGGGPLSPRTETATSPAPVRSTSTVAHRAPRTVSTRRGRCDRTRTSIRSTSSNSQREEARRATPGSGAWWGWKTGVAARGDGARHGGGRGGGTWRGGAAPRSASRSLASKSRSLAAARSSSCRSPRARADRCSADVAHTFARASGRGRRAGGTRARRWGSGGGFGSAVRPGVADRAKKAASKLGRRSASPGRKSSGIFMPLGKSTARASRRTGLAVKHRTDFRPVNARSAHPLDGLSAARNHRVDWTSCRPARRRQTGTRPLRASRPGGPRAPSRAPRKARLHGVPGSGRRLTFPRSGP